MQQQQAQIVALLRLRRERAEEMHPGRVEGLQEACAGDAVPEHVQHVGLGMPSLPRRHEGVKLGGDGRGGVLTIEPYRVKQRDVGIGRRQGVDLEVV